jgi:hypothetical protein
LTWARCECGCGWEGEDEVTQWLLEEAAFLALSLEEAKAERQALSAVERQTRLRAMAELQVAR